jgi:hypothetical protein
MKLISHRGNINGPDLEKENRPDQIEYCIRQGYDVEIDLRITSDRRLYLGHDEPQYEITWWWLAKYQNNFWIHCKDLNTLTEMSSNTHGYNYFWHQMDSYTLTSKKNIWAYPGYPFSSHTVIVMPEWNENNDWCELKNADCFGICSDYIGEMK